MTEPRKYYRQEILSLYKFLIPKGQKKLVINNPTKQYKGKYDYIVLDELIGKLEDIQDFLIKVHKNCNPNSRVIVTYYNHLWEPLLKLVTYLGWRRRVGEQNWLDNSDISNLLDLAGFEVITKQKRLLLPLDVPYVSDLFNKWIAHLPIVNNLCLITWVIARPAVQARKDYSVSIVIPARNEEGNIANAIRKLPKFGIRQEIIFVEGHSKDNTWGKIQQVIKNNKRRDLAISGYQQTGIGKADAVRLGFKKSTGDLLMILDADLTVDPKELPKFYEAIASGKGEYINGSRLVYPMEKDAMRMLNKAGNIVFSWLFTWILGQRIKDTLCGTKVILKRDYEKIVKNRSFFGDFDPFGDFDLIFGAIKQNMKLIEIPIRYKERTYGSTNISRFKHGWLLLKMTTLAFMKLKAW